MLVFFYAPIVMLMAFSFSSEKSRATWGHFTFKWYAELFQNPEILSALRTTVLVALISAVLATIIGTIAAIGIYGYKNSVRTVLMNLTYLPILNPDIVTGISLMILFVFMKLNLGFFTMLLSHMVFNIPYVIYSVWPKLNQMDKSVYEAAMDLGARPAYAMRKVILPQIAPGVVTGFILAITLSIDDFVISFFTSSGVQNLSIYIYSAARRGIDPTLYALMTLMFVVVLTLLSIVNLRSNKQQTTLDKRR
ncbi:MAG: ABC transporter permease [Eubacteriales bacterium]|nr:ABC transporter permease [Eubacteriales bacterium]